MQEVCDLNSRNLCKGLAIQDYLASQEEVFSRVVYIGDGKNDFCPLTFLGPQDLALVRKNHSLHKHLTSNEMDMSEIKARINYWQDGGDIQSLFA